MDTINFTSNKRRHIQDGEPKDSPEFVCDPKLLPVEILRCIVSLFNFKEVFRFSMISRYVKSLRVPGFIRRIGIPFSTNKKNPDDLFEYIIDCIDSDSYSNKICTIYKAEDPKQIFVCNVAYTYREEVFTRLIRLSQNIPLIISSQLIDIVYENEDKSFVFENIRRFDVYKWGGYKINRINLMTLFPNLNEVGLEYYNQGENGARIDQNSLEYLNSLQIIKCNCAYVTAPELLPPKWRYKVVCLRITDKPEVLQQNFRNYSIRTMVITIHKNHPYAKGITLQIPKTLRSLKLNNFNGLNAKFNFWIVDETESNEKFKLINLETTNIELIFGIMEIPAYKIRNHFPLLTHFTTSIGGSDIYLVANFVHHLCIKNLTLRQYDVYEGGLLLLLLSNVYSTNFEEYCCVLDGEYTKDDIPCLESVEELNLSMAAIETTFIDLEKIITDGFFKNDCVVIEETRKNGLLPKLVSLNYIIRLFNDESFVKDINNPENLFATLDDGINTTLPKNVAVCTLTFTNIGGDTIYKYTLENKTIEPLFN